MNIVERAKKICLSPTTEWPVIAGEETSTSELLTGYVAPLAGIGALAGFVGGSLVGYSLPFVGTYRVPFFTGIGMAIFTFVMAIVGVFILSVIIDQLAPTFGGEKNSAQALKAAVYSYTPAWVAGFLQILPMLGILSILGGLYGIYLLYLGLPRLMKSPQEKAIAYTAVVVVCAVVLSFIVSAVGGMFVGAGMMSGALGSAMGGSAASSEVEFDPDSPLGKLEEFGRRVEESADRMKQAEQSGDTQAQVNAAMETLGTILGGGRRVDPVNVDTLRGFVPESLAGLARTSSNVERTGMASLMVTKAEATYGDGAGREIDLEITDTGGVSGLMGLAGWIGAAGQEKEDDTMSERTRTVDGRLTHEKVSKTGGPNEFALVLGDRFIVNTTGRGVDLEGLKSAVSNLDLAGLEALKESGVQ